MPGWIDRYYIVGLKLSGAIAVLAQQGGAIHTWADKSMTDVSGTMKAICDVFF